MINFVLRFRGKVKKFIDSKFKVCAKNGNGGPCFAEAASQARRPPVGKNAVNRKTESCAGILWETPQRATPYFGKRHRGHREHRGQQEDGIFCRDTCAVGSAGGRPGHTRPLAAATEEADNPACGETRHAMARLHKPGYTQPHPAPEAHASPKRLSRASPAPYLEFRGSGIRRGAQ